MSTELMLMQLYHKLWMSADFESDFERDWKTACNRMRECGKDPSFSFSLDSRGADHGSAPKFHYTTCLTFLSSIFLSSTCTKIFP